MIFSSPKPAKINRFAETRAILAVFSHKCLHFHAGDCMRLTIPHAKLGMFREKSGPFRPVVSMKIGAVRFAGLNRKRSNKAWHCPIFLCVSFSKLVFTLVTRRIAGTRR
ncbi:hypothetical protein F3P66_07425 [Agrobacterium fabrum]|nr:hypothetical protein F3P66_07425 [Agrobacterium fabrum]